MELIRLPRKFADDSADRLCAGPDPVRASERFIWVRGDDPGMVDLLADARYYASPEWGPGHGEWTENGMVPWHLAAKRLLAAWNKPRPSLGREV